MSRRLGRLLLPALVALLCSIAPAAALANGSISGTVTMGGDVYEPPPGSPFQVPHISIYDDVGSEAQDQVDADPVTGAYQFSDLPDGDYRLHITAPYPVFDYVDEYFNDKTTLEAATPITVAGAAVTGKDVDLAPNGRVTGTVTTPAPLVNGEDQVSVFIESVDGGPRSTGATNADGTYDLPAVGFPEGDYLVSFASLTFADLTTPAYGYSYYSSSSPNGTYDRSQATPVHIVPGETTPDIDLTLTSGATVSGTVTDGTNPLANVEVYFLDSKGQQVDFELTDSDGKYTSTLGLPPIPLKVRFKPAYNDTTRAGEYNGDKALRSEATALSLTAGGEVDNVDATLDPAGAIQGYLTGPNYGALLGGHVDAIDADGNVAGSAFAIGVFGTYTIRNLRPGTYKLQAVDEGYPSKFFDAADSLATATPVTVVAGAPGADYRAIELAPEPNTTGTISGTLSGPKGTLYGGVVNLYDADNDDVGSAFPATDGTWSLTGVMPGHYRLQYSHLGCKTEYGDDTTTLGTAPSFKLKVGSVITGKDATLADKTADSCVTDPVDTDPEPTVTATVTATATATTTATATAIASASPTATATAVPTATATSTATPDPAEITIEGGSSFSVSSGGSIGVDLSCPADAGSVCLGTAGLVQPSGSRQAAIAKRRSLGSRAFGIGPGRTKEVRIRLNKTGRRLLRKHHKVKAILRITMAHTPATTKRIKLVAPKKKKH